MPHIVILDAYTVNPGDNSWEPIEQLGTLDVYERTAVDQVIERSRGADILITNKTPISAQTIERLPHLKFISVLATGYNIVDLDAAQRHRVVVSNVPEYGSRTVAQFTWSLILELCHQVGLHSESVWQGDWSRCQDFCYWRTEQIELAGLKLGLVGFGRIARHVGEIGMAMGMSVIACGRPGASHPATPRVRWATIDEVFSKSDVVSLHCPLTSETEQIVSHRLLNKMRSNAILVNTSRGGLINESDLAAALHSKAIAGAAVDVVSQEPIHRDNPLIQSPNCLITPHIAWSSLAARRRIVATTAYNIAAFVANEPTNVVVDIRR